MCAMIEHFEGVGGSWHGHWLLGSDSSKRYQDSCWWQEYCNNKLLSIWATHVYIYVYLYYYKIICVPCLSHWCSSVVICVWNTNMEITLRCKFLLKVLLARSYIDKKDTCTQVAGDTDILCDISAGRSVLCLYGKTLVRLRWQLVILVISCSNVWSLLFHCYGMVLESKWPKDSWCSAGKHLHCFSLKHVSTTWCFNIWGLVLFLLLFCVVVLDSSCRWGTILSFGITPMLNNFSSYVVGALDGFKVVMLVPSCSMLLWLLKGSEFPVLASSCGTSTPGIFSAPIFFPPKKMLFCLNMCLRLRRQTRCFFLPSSGDKESPHMRTPFFFWQEAFRKLRECEKHGFL